MEVHLDQEGFEVRGFDKFYGHDIRDYEQVRDYLDIARPDYIFHLAAQAFVGESFANPQRVIEVNTIGSLNILEAVRQLGLKTKILLAGTSEEYGGGDVGEEDRLEPASPYAVSKAAMDQLGQLYAKAYGMHIVVTRAFNHTGAGRGEMYAESAFAKQIAEIEFGKRKVLEHGNLDPYRNYTDVADVVEAYRLAIDLPSDVYNICSDQNVSIKEVLGKLCNLSTVNIERRPKEGLLRPYDFSFKQPNCRKLQNKTGWKSKVPLEQTLQSILTYWRDKV